MDNQALTIGKAAAEAGVSAKAARLYETKGLLPDVHRTEAGYRLYSDEHVAALRFIRQAQTLGLTLAEIGDILTIRSQGTPTCRHVLQLLDRRITEIDRTIAELRQLRRTLATTREHAAESVAPDTVGGIIEHHGSDAEEA